MKKHILTLLTVLLAITESFAQPVDMATTLRSEGKIYVVLGVMLIIFLGVAIYLFSLDRRIKKLERQDK